LIARREKRLEDAQREVRHIGGEALMLPGDMADPSTAETAAQRVEHTFGPIDVWVNNARCRRHERQRTAETTHHGLALPQTDCGRMRTDTRALTKTSFTIPAPCSCEPSDARI
jgi:NAD(P)-dependent dehydrogenase (short-subunit alcohol dehydrogenase family)